MAEKKALENEEIKEYGQIELNENRQQHNIQLLSIIGEVEGHECLASNTKTTKYEHVLPKLAEAEDDRTVDVFCDIVYVKVLCCYTCTLP